MAIVIPSKHIYSKSFDPVIDNNIDRVGIRAKKIMPDNHYNEAVYNEDTYIGFTLDNESLSDQHAEPTYRSVTPINPVVYFYGSYVYADNQYYISKVINIPIQQDNAHIVTQLLLGLNKEGEKNIKYTCAGKINKGTANSLIVFTATTVNVTINSYHSSLIPPVGENAYSQTEETDGNYFISTEESNVVTNEDGTISVKAEIDIPTIDNLGEVTASEVTINNKKYLQLDIQNLLCGIRITKGGGRGTALPLENNQTVFSGQIRGGYYVEYIPETVTITVYANTIGIDLQENTLTIGDGNKVFSFDGNELIQTTNTPSIESKYQGVIDKLKNGKQTATITCPITDYYNESGNKVIDITTSGKMLFKEGDIIIPYTYTNRGDKPISYNKDFTPKQFKVVGTKISKEQGGMQELTLQEV